MADSGIRIFNNSLELYFFKILKCSQYTSIIYQNLQNFMLIPNMLFSGSADTPVKSYWGKCEYIYFFSKFPKNINDTTNYISKGKETTKTTFYSTLNTYLLLEYITF